MSDATYTKFGVIEESTEGTTPASAVQLMNVRDVQLRQSRDPEKPEILTGDRRSYPTRVLRKSGELSLPMYMQYENDLELMEGLQNAARGTAVTVTATTISFATSTKKISDSGSGLGSFAIGDMIYVSGASVAGNNGWKGPVLAAAAGELTLPTGQITDESASASITIATRRLLDGTTEKFYSVEYQRTKLTNFFYSGTGFHVGGAQFSWSQGDFAMVDWSLMGRVPAKANATIGTGAASAAPTTGFMTGVDGFGGFTVGSASDTLISNLIVTDWKLNAQNVLNPVYGLGNVGPSKHITGKQSQDLDITAYHDDAAEDLVDAVLAHTSLWFTWHVLDAEGNRIAFCLPSAKPDEGDPVVGNAGNLGTVPVKLSGHDPAKDSTSLLTTIPYQFGIFFAPAA